MKKKPLSRAEQKQVSALAKLEDRDIDTTDIPEVPAENWANRRKPDRVLRQHVTGTEKRHT